MKNKRFDHAVRFLPVRDSDETIKLYRDQLGFAILHQEEGFVVLGRDDARVHLWQAGDESWRERDSLEEPVRSGAEPFIAETASCRVLVEGVDDLYEELTAKDVLHPVSRGGVSETDFGSREFATLDQDGNLISFFECS